MHSLTATVALLAGLDKIVAAVRGSRCNKAASLVRDHSSDATMIVDTELL